MSEIRALIVVVAALHAVVVPVWADGVVSADEIVWSLDRPLRWQDFRAPSEPNAPSERVALTAASLAWRYDYKVDGLGQDCSYRIRGVHAQAIFDPARSWVRPGHLADSVLAHEQGHFDITEMYRRKLEEGARELLGISTRCEGETYEEAMVSTKASAGERMGVVYKKIWDDYLAFQQRYDDETRHGIVTESQQRWSHAIAAELAGDD